MRVVREVGVESPVSGDATVTLVGWTRPPRARDVLAEYKAGADDRRPVYVGNGFIRVHVSGDRPQFTLQLLDSEPPWDLPGWRSAVGGADIYRGKRVSCTVDQSGVPGEIGLDLPEENMFFRLYIADPDDAARQRFLVQFWPTNPLTLIERSNHLDESGNGNTEPAEESRGLQRQASCADDFNGVWSRLMLWLDAHAPTSRAAIRPPASHDALTAAQTAFDRPWPADLVRLYEVCDGTADASRWGFQLFPLTPVIPLDYMLSIRDIRADVQREFPPDPDDPPEDDSVTAEPHDVWVWSPRYVPFAEDISGDGFFVDLRDGPAFGSVGRWLHADNRTAALWPSLTAALTEIAEALEHTRDFDGWTPVVTASHELEWEPAHHHP